jgi:hypothetical protein
MRKATTKKASKKTAENLSDNLASEAREVAERILDLLRREQVAEGNLLLIRIETGRQLNSFKEKLLDGVKFTDWVRNTFPMDLRTAERSMALWRAFGEKTTLVSKLGLKA